MSIDKTLVQKIDQLVGVTGEPHFILIQGEDIDTGCMEWPIPSDRDVDLVDQKIRKMESELLAAAERGDRDEGHGLAEEINRLRSVQKTADPHDTISSIFWSVRKLLELHDAVVYRDFMWEYWNYVTANAIIVAPTTDPYDILRIEHTNAINHGFDTEELIPKLQELDSMIGIEIIGAGFDAVEFLLNRIPEGLEAKRLGEWLLELCPEIDEAPTDFRQRHVALWWD